MKSGFAIHLAEAGALSSLHSLHMDSGLNLLFSCAGQRYQRRTIRILLTSLELTWQ